MPVPWVTVSGVWKRERWRRELAILVDEGIILEIVEGEEVGLELQASNESNFYRKIAETTQTARSISKAMREIIGRGFNE